MKINFSHKLASALIVFVSLLSFASFGQDEGQPLPAELQDANHQELNLNTEDKTLIYEHSSKSGKSTSSETPQNSILIPAKAKNSETNKPASIPSNSNTKDGDDALSFNFLFYIIQKYKFADIIDQ